VLADNARQAAPRRRAALSYVDLSLFQCPRVDYAFPEGIRARDPEDSHFCLELARARARAPAHRWLLI
jgi:hypothetical protein